eukprot:2733843-Prymnesium_polylepis.1
MKTEAHGVVGYSLDCLWAAGSTVRQRLAAKGWSAGLLTALPDSRSGPAAAQLELERTACRGRAGYRTDASDDMAALRVCHVPTGT